MHVTTIQKLERLKYQTCEAGDTKRQKAEQQNTCSEKTKKPNRSKTISNYRSTQPTLNNKLDAIFDEELMLLMTDIYIPDCSKSHVLDLVYNTVESKEDDLIENWKN